MWAMWRSGLSRTVSTMGLLACVACASGTQATRSEEPAAGPPQAGEPFAEFAPLPAGPQAVVEGVESDVAPVEMMAEPQGTPGHIQRGALERFVAHGPGYALQLVQVQPAFSGGRFTGFQIVAVSEEGSRLMGGALQPGDVVVRVNRRAISRPEDYMAAWESLKGCGEVSLQIMRGGQPMELVWPVEG